MFVGETVAVSCPATVSHDIGGDTSGDEADSHATVVDVPVVTERSEIHGRPLTPPLGRFTHWS
eukprot:965578-Rhodomonas_salina.3